MVDQMDDFRKEVIKELEKMLGDGYDIFPKDNIKNNGFTAHGICIHKKGSTTGTVAYLDGYILLFVLSARRRAQQKTEQQPAAEQSKTE